MSSSSSSSSSSNQLTLSEEQSRLASEQGIAFAKVEPVDEDMMDVENDDNSKPVFDRDHSMSGRNTSSSKKEKARQMRRIPVPQHRYSPLKKNWQDILVPLVEHLKLQVRMNVKKRAVEIRLPDKLKGNKTVSNVDVGHLQKAADFLRAFMMGFDLGDAVALLRLDDLFIDSFEVKDVKRLGGDHLSRCIGRIAGKSGQTKYAIENATKTRLVVADRFIHILGSFQNIKLARDAVCSLILGQPQTKVYQHLRTVTKRVQERL